jgi:hypothetical protein
LGGLRLSAVLGALAAPGAGPAGGQAAVLVPVLVGAVVGWRCARRVPPVLAGEDARAGVRSAVLDAVAAAARAARALGVRALASSGSAGPGQRSDVGPSAWRVGLALLAELGAGAAVTAWIVARRGEPNR